jgi:acetyl esterase/lipase
MPRTDRWRRIIGPAAVVLGATLLLAVAVRASPLPGVHILQAPYTSTMTVDVYAPTGGHGRPVLVLLHGCCGSKEDLSQFAWAAAVDGAVVFNPDLLSMVRGGRFPTVYQQAACAVRFARATASRYGGDPDRVTLLGWSDGAMLAAVVGNAADHFSGDCLAHGGSGVPDAVIGVGGFFGWPVAPEGRVDARYVTPRTVQFFGGSPARAPLAWAAGNPYTYLGRNRGLEVALLVGATDPLLDGNRRFVAALRGAGQRATLRIVPGDDPLTLISPRTDQGHATLQETLRVARGEVQA